MRPDLPSFIYSAAATRELDAQIIAAGTPGFELMQRAAAAVWRELRRRWPHAGRLTVFCGGGNNGGDGYLVARLAERSGWQVQVWAVAPPERLQGDAHRAWQAARDAGVDIRCWTGEQVREGVIVDALLGTGLRAPVREPFQRAIAAINASGLPVVAVDLPSGLDADRGVADCAVRADLTVTFIVLKPGLLTGQGPDQAGELCFAALADLPASGVAPVLERLTLARCRAWLPARPRAAHKGMFGHLLVIGGNRGMGGAIMLAAETALRCGAGKVSVATRSDHVPSILARCPEVMAHGVDDPAQLAALLKPATAVVLGPGLGTDSWAQQLLDQVLAHDAPRILDADALNLIAAAPQPRPLGPGTVMTPHPAEAARLLGCATAAVQADRLAAARRLAERFGCTAVLKGVGSLVADPDPRALPALCSAGNPGMASAGMGDVLSGLVGALLAQHLEAGAAARYAVLLHALAGDRAAEQGGQLGLIASDLISSIRYYLNLRDI